MLKEERLPTARPKEGFERMSPLDAAALLKRLDPNQRPFNSGSYERLKRSIQHRGWVQWKARVLVSARGTVVNGQHTLTYVARQPVDSRWNVWVTRL